MKFAANKIDLTLELTTLSGEEVVVRCPEVPSAAYAEEVAQFFVKEEEARKVKIEKDEEVESNIDFVIREIMFVYGKDLIWWKTNFDFKLLTDILTWTANELSGLGKGGNS